MKPLNRLLGKLSPGDYDQAIAFCLFAYTKTELGSYLWQAYQYAREGNRHIPAVVLKYLDACAAAVADGGSGNEITANMMLRHRRGGAGTAKRKASADWQVSILHALLIEYDNVRAGNTPSKVEARRIVAQRFCTTEGRVHQLEIKAGL